MKLFFLRVELLNFRGSIHPRKTSGWNLKITPERKRRNIDQKRSHMFHLTMENHRYCRRLQSPFMVIFIHVHQFRCRFQIWKAIKANVRHPSLVQLCQIPEGGRTERQTGKPPHRDTRHVDIKHVPTHPKKANQISLQWHDNFMKNISNISQNNSKNEGLQQK